jgi:hypothetical protein
MTVVGQGLDQSLLALQETSPSGGWGSWVPLGGLFASAPYVHLEPGGSLEAFGVGAADNALYHLTQASPGGAWTAPTSIGGAVRGAPSIVAARDGHLELFQQGIAGNLYHRTRRVGSSTWGGFSQLGGTVTSWPTSGNEADGRAVVWARDPGSAIVYRVLSASNVWGAWLSLGGSTVTF